MKPDRKDRVVRGKRKPSQQRRAWCRGKQGVEHKPAWRLYRSWPTMREYDTLVYECTECKKQLEYIWRITQPERYAEIEATL